MPVNFPDSAQKKIADRCWNCHAKFDKMSVFWRKI